MSYRQECVKVKKMKKIKWILCTSYFKSVILSDLKVKSNALDHSKSRCKRVQATCKGDVVPLCFNFCDPFVVSGACLMGKIVLVRAACGLSGVKGDHVRMANSRISTYIVLNVSSLLMLTPTSHINDSRREVLST